MGKLARTLRSGTSITCKACISTNFAIDYDQLQRQPEMHSNGLLAWVIPTPIYWMTDVVMSDRIGAS